MPENSRPFPVDTHILVSANGVSIVRCEPCDLEFVNQAFLDTHNHREHGQEARAGTAEAAAAAAVARYRAGPPRPALPEPPELPDPVTDGQGATEWTREAAATDARKRQRKAARKRARQAAAEREMRAAPGGELRELREQSDAPTPPSLGGPDQTDAPPRITAADLGDPDRADNRLRFARHQSYQSIADDYGIPRNVVRDVIRMG